MAVFAATGTAVQGTSNNRGVAQDGGGSDGDLLVVEGYLSDSTGLAATGWTVNSYAVVVGGVDYDYVVLWRIRSGSGEAALTWTNTVFFDFVMHRFTGAHASTPVESITVGTAVAATGKVAPSVSSTYDNSLLADFAIEDDFSAWTPDADFTERWDGGATHGSFLATRQLAAAGATGTDTHTSGGSNGGIAVRMVIVDDVPTGGGNGDLTLQSIAAVSSLANVVVASPATVALGTIAAVSALNNMVVASPAPLALGTIAAVSALNNLTVAAPVLIALDPIAAVSALPNVALASPIQITLDPIAAVSSLANMALASPIIIALDPIAAVSDLPNVAVAGPGHLALDAIAAVSALNNITITTDADLPGAQDGFMLFKVAAGQGRT